MLEPLAVGAIQLLAGIVSLWFLKLAVDSRDKPGSSGFILLMLGVVLWSFAVTVGKLTGSRPLSLARLNVVFLSAQIVTVSWLLIALQATDRAAVTRRLLAGLAAYVLVGQLFFWTNGLHHLMLGEETAMLGVVPDPEFEIGFWVVIGVGYLFVLAGTGILAAEARRSSGVRRKQMLILTLAIVPFVAGNLVSVSDVLGPYDVSPVGFLLSAALFAVGLFRYQFLDIATIARGVVVSEIDDAMVIVDSQSRVIDANPTARELFGVSDEYTGMSAAEFFGPVSDQLAQYVEAESTDTELTLTVGGATRHYSLSVSPVDEGEQSGRVLLFREITARKEREQQLESYESLFERTSDCIVETEYVDGEPIVRSVNDAFEETFGFAETEIVGRSLDEVIVPEEHADEAAQINRQERDDNTISREVSRQTADGKREFIFRSIHHSDEHSYGIYTDITDRKEREREIKRKNERLSALFENTRAGVVEYVIEDGVPVCEDVNRRFEEIFGYDAETVVGESIDEFIVPPAHHEEADHLNETVRRGEYLSAEVDRQTVDGVRSFLLRNAPIDTDDESTVRGYAIYTDITERKERERRIRRQNERLDAFAGTVSHDLRNPLNVAQLRADVLAQTYDDDEDVQVVQQSLDRMEAMVDELLRLARAGGEVEETEPHLLADLVRQSWETVQTDGLELDLQLDSLVIDAETARLQHLFENLFRNALDHNDAPVVVRVGPLEEADGFYVEDDGDGIPEADRDSVLDHGYTTSEDGTGFGLAIVSEVADAHGWEITIQESTAGGARFEILTDPKGG